MLYDYIYISGFNLLISIGCAYPVTFKKISPYLILKSLKSNKAHFKNVGA